MNGHSISHDGVGYIADTILKSLWLNTLHLFSIHMKTTVVLDNALRQLSNPGCFDVLPQFPRQGKSTWRITSQLYFGSDTHYFQHSPLARTSLMTSLDYTGTGK